MEMQQMLERLLAGQEQMRQQIVADMGANQAKVETDRKADQKRMEENQAKAEANLADMKESLKEAMTVAVSAIEEKMEATVHSTRSERDEKVPGRSENVTELQEIPKEWAAVANVDCKDQRHKEWESGVERRMVPTEEVARTSF
jgi:DNA anti-recombination protein RmuC